MSKTEESGTAEDSERPTSGREAIVRALKSSEDLLTRALHSRKGYCADAIDVVEEKWGPEMVPGSGSAYVATTKHDFANDLRDYAIEQGWYEPEPVEQEAAEVVEEIEEATESQEEVTEENVSVAELAASAASSLQVNNTETRVQEVVLTDEDLLYQAADEVPLSEKFIQKVKAAVEEEHGMFYSPTEAAVESAVSSLRLQGLLPEEDERDGLEASEEPQSIKYTCSLCGYENSDYYRVRDHITATDDATHHDRTGKEVHLVEVQGEELETTHEAFEDEEFQATCDDGFDVIWSIYENPGARQKDLADMLGISQSHLSRRLNALGIEWEDRVETVNEMIESWESGGTVSREEGNVTYEGPETGVDTTSGAPTQNITERPAPDQRVEISLTRRQAEEFLWDEDASAVKQKVYRALTDDQ